MNCTLVNNNKNNDFSKCYQVNGTWKMGTKEFAVRFFAYANSEEQAKQTFNNFNSALPIKYNFTTLADALNGFKREYKRTTDFDSEEFKEYIGFNKQK